jgi:hypothetical protein
VAAVGNVGNVSYSEEEMVPLKAQVQLQLEGACVQLDSFADAALLPQPLAGHADRPAPHLRCSVSVRSFEVRDSFQPRQGGANSGSMAGWSDLRRMLGYHASLHRVRGDKECMAQIVMEGYQGEADTGMKRADVCLPSCLLVIEPFRYNIMSWIYV